MSHPLPRDPLESIHWVFSGCVSSTSELGASNRHHLQSCLPPQILLIPRLGDNPSYNLGSFWAQRQTYQISYAWPLEEPLFLSLLVPPATPHRIQAEAIVCTACSRGGSPPALCSHSHFPSGKVSWVHCRKQNLVADAQALDWACLGLSNGSATYQLCEFRQVS